MFQYEVFRQSVIGWAALGSFVLLSFPFIRLDDDRPQWIGAIVLAVLSSPIVGYLIGQLHATAFKRTLAWASTSEGRRIHDLRHTAACLWLARGVDVVTVQAWMGHASVATTNLYLHHLGTAADRAGLDRLNRPGHTGGTPEADRTESHDGEW